MKYSDYMIGSVVRDLRLKKGFTLTEGAEYVGLSTSTYNRIENGLSPFHLRDFIEFCYSYNIHSSTFFTRLKNFEPKVLL